MTPSSALNKSEIIDIPGLVEIIGESRERMGKIRELFVSVFDEIVGAIENSLPEADEEALAMHIHTLRGAAANLHAVEIKKISGELDSLNQAHQWDAFPEKIAALHGAYERYLNAFDALRDSF